jgi:hypothetical protein
MIEGDRQTKKPATCRKRQFPRPQIRSQLTDQREQFDSLSGEEMKLRFAEKARGRNNLTRHSGYLLEMPVSAEAKGIEMVKRILLLSLSLTQPQPQKK